ncbi:hypothetical protein [Salinicoccus halodurans]|uniref:Cardiolipin synthase N-terminal domain-containing protein n=1 Tax=Salinicoccus halodurans TaxID=407035 RepID=A0A0F7HLJ3_9STAP|nr:hypothetical protein [Salinicoccus halodurans]AKG73967.1 hypothetical protein AAT16_06825 [Salinicoccus halodurans]SFK58608.1 hypothetical protein SAMN05216235_0609 [Salinicoccus halodurans]
MSTLFMIIFMILMFPIIATAFIYLIGNKKEFNKVILYIWISAIFIAGLYVLYFLFTKLL